MHEQTGDASLLWMRRTPPLDNSWAGGEKPAGKDSELQRGLAPHLGYDIAATYQARNLIFAAERCTPPVAWVSIHLRRCHTLEKA